VEDAFGIVLVVVVVAAALVAVATLVASSRTYDEIGRGGMSLRDGSDRGPREPAGAAPPTAAAERDEEIRQMLEARNARRVRRGQEPLDVEAELATLSHPRVDPALEAEIRALVEARNARRARHGQEPLDVDAEVARRVRELEGGGEA
jgi:hypothetical protein